MGRRPDGADHEAGKPAPPVDSRRVRAGRGEDARPLQDAYCRLRPRKGFQKAIVAVALEMVRTMHGMVAEGRDCDCAIEGNVRRKASEMRSKARWITTAPDVAATVARFALGIAERVARGRRCLDADARFHRRRMGRGRRLPPYLQRIALPVVRKVQGGESQSGRVGGIPA